MAAADRNTINFDGEDLLLLPFTLPPTTGLPFRDQTIWLILALKVRVKLWQPTTAIQHV